MSSMPRTLTALLAFLPLMAAPAAAHFQQLLPSADVLPEGGKVTLELVFTHPMDRGPVMNMARPVQFGVLMGGKKTSLLPQLKERKITGKSTWSAEHSLPKPGTAIYYVEPQPYWEPDEGKLIVHYTKVVVDSYATGENWDALVGLPVEIKPLTRPSGIWTGNIFRGVVLKDGKPVPFAEVEVEWVNDGSVKAPNDAFVTQVIKADANGTFAYAMPRSGWWGFAALLEADAKRKAPNGKDVPVELGALMWVKTTNMTGSKK